MNISIEVADRNGSPAYVAKVGGKEQWTHAAHLVENPRPRDVIVQMEDNFEMLLGERPDLLTAFAALKKFPQLDDATVGQLKSLNDPPAEWIHVS